MPPQSPFKQQLIPSITSGLTSQQAASALSVTRQTINAARRNTTYSSDNIFPPATPNILTTKYPLHVKRVRKLTEKHEAIKWLKDNLPVKSGSKNVVHTQHDQNYQVYQEYKNDMTVINTSKYNHIMYTCLYCHMIVFTHACIYAHVSSPMSHCV